MERLAITTLAAQDISSPLLVATHTADADRELLVQLYLSGLVGGGIYRVHMTKQLNGAGSVYRSAITEVILPAGITTMFVPTIPLPARTGDVAKVYAQGLGGDVSVGVQTEVFDTMSTLANDAAAAVWNYLLTAMTTVGSIGRALRAFLVGRYKFDKATYVETISDPAGVAVVTRTVTDTAAEVNKA